LIVASPLMTRLISQQTGRSIPVLLAELENQ